MSSRGIAYSQSFSLEERLQTLWPNMLHFARKLCARYKLPDYLAEDLAQLAWLDAHRCYTTIEKPKYFKTWVLSVVKNKVRSEARKCHDEELDDHEVLDFMVDETPNAEEVLMQSQKVE